MKFLKEVKVYYADTDAYKIAWHGNYLKWMESARCDLCEELGFSLVDLAENEGIIFPIANINLRYKTPAKLYDDLVIETQIKEFKKSFIVFEQIIKEKSTQNTCVIGEITVVAVDKNGKMIKTLPDYIKTAFEKYSPISNV